MPSTSSSVSTFSTSSSSTQAHLLSSPSAIIPTIQIPPVLTTANKFAALSTEVRPSVPLSESATPTPNSELSNSSKVPQNVKQNSKNRRKRTKVQKPEIEIKMAKHKPRKSAPTEYTTDDEDLLMYDAEEELETDPTDKFVFKERPTNFPKGYLRSLTPTRFRKKYINTERHLGHESLPSHIRESFSVNLIEWLVLDAKESHLIGCQGTGKGMELNLRGE
ncbi:hypothetical protein TNCV_1156061 [Trichonephila clavipes]|nr:hypothetical protein TNCV_1156061 [Trichonephila clavipes]